MTLQFILLLRLLFHWFNASINDTKYSDWIPYLLIATQKKPLKLIVFFISAF